MIVQSEIKERNEVVIGSSANEVFSLFLGKLNTGKGNIISGLENMVKMLQRVQSKPETKSSVDDEDVVRFIDDAKDNIKLLVKVFQKNLSEMKNIVANSQSNSSGFINKTPAVVIVETLSAESEQVINCNNILFILIIPINDEPAYFFPMNKEANLNYQQINGLLNGKNYLKELFDLDWEDYIEEKIFSLKEVEHSINLINMFEKVMSIDSINLTKIKSSFTKDLKERKRCEYYRVDDAGVDLIKKKLNENELHSNNPKALIEYAKNRLNLTISSNKI